MGCKFSKTEDVHSCCESDDMSMSKSTTFKTITITGRDKNLSALNSSAEFSDYDEDDLKNWGKGIHLAHSNVVFTLFYHK